MHHLRPDGQSYMRESLFPTFALYGINGRLAEVVLEGVKSVIRLSRSLCSSCLLYMWRFSWCRQQVSAANGQTIKSAANTQYVKESGAAR